jgi:hypothetical protein
MLPLFHCVASYLFEDQQIIRHYDCACGCRVAVSEEKCELKIQVNNKQLSIAIDHKWLPFDSIGIWSDGSWDFQNVIVPDECNRKEHKPWEPLPFVRHWITGAEFVWPSGQVWKPQWLFVQTTELTPSQIPRVKRIVDEAVRLLGKATMQSWGGKEKKKVMLTASEQMLQLESDQRGTCVGGDFLVAVEEFRFQFYVRRDQNQTRSWLVCRVNA